MGSQKNTVIPAPIVLFLIMVMAVCFSKVAGAQTVPPYQRNNFQYVTGVLTSTDPVSTYVASAFNANYLPKYYSLAVTTAASSAFAVNLEGSLDNSNWSTLGVTNSVFGVLSVSVPKPMLYIRVRASSIASNTSVTATAIGTP